MGLARTPPPTKLANTTTHTPPITRTPVVPTPVPSTPVPSTPVPLTPVPSTPVLPSRSPKKIYPRFNSPIKQENSRTSIPIDSDPFKKKPKLIRSPPPQLEPIHSEHQPLEQTPLETQSEPLEKQTIQPETTIVIPTKPSSIPIPINQSKSPKKSISKTVPSQPINPTQSSTNPNKQKLPQVQSLPEHPPPPIPSVINSESHQVIKEIPVINNESHQAIREIPSTKPTREGSHTTEDLSVQSTLTSAEPPSHPSQLDVHHPPTTFSPVISSIIKLPLFEHDSPQQRPALIEPLVLPAKFPSTHHRVEPPTSNRSKKETLKPVGPKDTLRRNQVEKVANISNDAQLASKTTHLTSFRLSTPPKSFTTTYDAADLSRESDLAFVHNIQFLEHRIQELEQMIKLMENEILESELVRQVHEAQSIWDKEFGSSKKEDNDRLMQASSDENSLISSRFELEVALLELKELENQLTLKELENRLLKEKIDQVQSEYQSRDQVLINELERSRMTNSEWAQIGHHFESLIEIERREKEELENRFQAQLRQTKLEPNFEINTLKYELIKSENRSELLEEQVTELLVKCNNLETQLLTEKNQKNQHIRDLELASLNVKNLSNQILDLTTALSEQHKGVGLNQRTLSQEILLARATLAEKEVEIANLKAQVALSSQFVQQQQQQDSENQPARIRKSGKNKIGVLSSTSQPPALDEEVEEGNNVEIVDETNGDQNEPPIDDPIRQITSDHWVSIGVVAKKINRNRKNHTSSQSPPIEPATKEDNVTIPVIEGSIDQDQPALLKKKIEKSSNIEKDLENPADVGIDYQLEEPLIQVTKKKVVKAKSKPAPQVPTKDNNDNESHDDKADDRENEGIKKNATSTKPARKGRAAKSKNPEIIANQDDVQTMETNKSNEVEKAVDKVAGGRKGPKGNPIEPPPTTVDHPPVAATDASSLPIASTRGEISLEGKSQLVAQDSTKLKRKKSFQIFKPTTPPSSPDHTSFSKQIPPDNSSPPKIPSQSSSPKKLQRKKSYDKIKKPQVHVNTSQDRNEETNVVVAVDKVKRVKNKVKAKGKAKDIDQETEQELKNDKEVEKKKTKEVEEGVEEKGKREKPKEKGERKVKGKNSSKEKKTEKEKVGMVNECDVDESLSTDQPPPTKIKRKRKEVESKDSKKLGKKSSSEEKKKKSQDDDSLVEDQEEEDDADNSLNKKKKRKLFNLKQKNLNWTHDNEDNMLGLPPELSPIKKSTASGNNEKKKKSSNKILPPSFLK